jgi:hypothetical protein
MFRNLISTVCLIISMWNWCLNSPDWRQWTARPKSTNQLQVYQEFSVSNYIILTDCYILNHWWLSMLSTHSYNIFHLLNTSNDQSIIITSMILQIASIWFGKAKRKPPDKREKEQELKGISSMLLDYSTYLIYLIED